LLVSQSSLDKLV